MSTPQTYIDYSIIGYNGVETLSTYSLSATPLLFVPDINQTVGNNNRVLWEFGDGTSSRSFSAYKVYTTPGVYTTSMIITDCFNNAKESTFKKDVTVYDYIPMTFRFSLNDSDYLSSIEFKCGEISGPFNIESFYPSYQGASDIYYNILGSASYNYWDINSNKFSHLENYYSLYDKIFNFAIGDYQYREIDKITFTPDRLYAKIQNNTVIRCGEKDSGAFYVGLSAITPVYFKDDSLSDIIVLNLFFDKLNYDLNSDNSKPKYINNLGLSLSAIVLRNDANALSITSNGLDGEGLLIDSFNINNSKFAKTSIPFVVKIKDENWFSVKNFEKIEIGDINISVLRLSGAVPSYTLSSINYTLSSQGSGGAFRGILYFPNTTDVVIDNLKLSASGTFSNGLSTYNLSGESNYFNIYPIDYYEMYKKNEDFNASNTLRDITFQESIASNDSLYDDFFGDLLGNDEYNHETIGVKIYEKISNFLQNTQDVDTCGVDFLNSLETYSNFSNIDEENHIYPETIKRLVDLGSISRYKLFGTPNKFKENLDIRSNSHKDVYGKNIGNQLDTLSYRVSAGVDIVALEKFSNTYSVLNTWQPVSAVETTIYPLSDYSIDWGWPLVLPLSMDFGDMSKYYIFFEYDSQYDNTLLDGVIDFDNDKTTIASNLSYSEFYSNNGVLDQMFLNTLYKSLSII